MTPDSSPQATREYVAAEAQRRSVEELMELVERQTVRLHALARSFSPAELTRPLDGDWSPLDCVSHVVDRTMLRAREVLYVALSGELPPHEDIALPSDMEELITAHREAVDSLYSHLREATDDFRAVEWAHPAVGSMTWPEWTVFIHVHLVDHADQLERMIAAR